MSWPMSFLMVALSVQTIAGFVLTSRSFSLNMWEPSDGIHRSSDWLALGTGLIFLLSAGYGWYRWIHNYTACWGFSGLPLVKLCLDQIGLVLLYFVFFKTKVPLSED
jgi:hypothetical protein